MKATTTLITIAATAFAASASVTSFTEDFESGANNWISGSFAPLTWNAAGAMDGSAYVSSSADLNSAGPFGLTLLRGQDDQDSSADAFVGNYLSSGITTVEFDFRHDAGMDLGIALRVAGSSNFPGFGVEQPSLVASGQWVRLSYDLSFFNPLLTLEGPPTPDFYNSVMEAVGNIQVSAFRPDGLTTPLIANFDLDNVSIVPAPGGIALLGLGCLTATRRRRS